MNWITIIFVFHVLRLNLCVAYNQVCPAAQYLNESGVCVDCTVCKQPDKNIVIRPCSDNADTVCGSVNDLIKRKGKSQNADLNKILDIKLESELPKDNISSITKTNGKKMLKPKIAKTKDYSYLDDDDYDYEDDDGDDYNDDKMITEKVSEMKLDIFTLNQSLADISNKLKPNRLGKQIKKDLSKNGVIVDSTPNETAPMKYNIFKDTKNIDDYSAMETILNKKLKSKKKMSEDHLKIGNTKFVINYEGRWLQVSHPHIVNKKIYVDLPKDKKASTFFSSSEKTEDKEYAKEMDQLLDKISSVVPKNTTVQNTTLNIRTPSEDYNLITDLDDEDEDDEDEDDDDEDDDKDDDDEDDEDEDDDDDYNIVYNPNSNKSRISDDSLEKTDSDLDDDYDAIESDSYGRKWLPPNDVKIDVIAEPFSVNANWQLLILVSAMSACLLFFVVVSTYVCIYMRKRRQFKTNFEADVEDLSVRVNLMQHAGFEADDTSNIKNYITQLRGKNICPHNMKPRRNF